MKSCSECKTVVAERAMTCSAKCRQRRSRRIRDERRGILPSRGGNLLILDAPTRGRLALALNRDTAYAPEGIAHRRWQAITRGEVGVLPLAEIRALASWYPRILKVLALPAGEDNTADPREA